jgi:long-chain acyl-CoA synthetase
MLPATLCTLMYGLMSYVADGHHPSDDGVPQLRQEIRVQCVIETLRQRAMQQPERVALVCGDQRVSYAEFWNHVVAAASHLFDCGVRPGDRVLLAAPSVPAFGYGYFATHLLGAVCVPIDPHAPTSLRDEIVRRTQPVLAFGVDANAYGALPCPSRVIDELDRLRTQQHAFTQPGLGSLADLLFTTGTTGRPKGVPLTHRNVAAATAHINAVIGTAESDVEVVPLPLYHSFGLGRLRCALSAGATIVLVQGFRLPGEIFLALERHEATALVGVPAGIAVLLRFGERGLGPFAGRLRYIEIGSAPMPIEHKRSLMHILPHTRLFMHYGLTEASRSAFIEFHRDSAHLETVGKPAPGVQVEVRDENGKTCGLGVSGMLWVGGAHVSPGYWDDAGLNAANFADGWTRTGDIAHLDTNGFIHLHGREDDLVNTGGNKVAPDEVERVLAEHPAVSEAACVGMPDPRGIAGQVLRAFLVAATDQPPPSAVELSSWVARQLEPYKVPARYDWVSELPRTASGKLVRAKLRERAP